MAPTVSFNSGKSGFLVITGGSVSDQTIEIPADSTFVSELAKYFISLTPDTQVFNMQGMFDLENFLKLVPTAVKNPKTRSWEFELPATNQSVASQASLASSGFHVQELRKVDGKTFYSAGGKEEFAFLRNQLLEPMAIAAVKLYISSRDETQRAYAMAAVKSLALTHAINWFTFKESPLASKDTPALLMVLGASLADPDKYVSILEVFASSRMSRDQPIEYLKLVSTYLDQIVDGDRDSCRMVLVKEIKNTIAGILRKYLPKGSDGKDLADHATPFVHVVRLLRENQVHWATESDDTKAILTRIMALGEQLYYETADKNNAADVAKGALYKALGDAKLEFTKVSGSAEVCELYARVPVKPVAA